jgi:hypothetical protein
VRTIKTLGIATAMALALIAVAGAGAASAASMFEAPGAGAEEMTKWTGTRSGTNHKLKLGGESFSCSKVSFVGEMRGPQASEINVSPELAECEWQTFFTKSWTMNGCKFRLRAQSTAVDIAGCEKPMTFYAASLGNDCRVEIGNQNGVGTVSYTNTETEGVKTVTMTANLNSITYTRTAGGYCVENKSGTFSNGTYTGTWIIKGTTSAGKSYPININQTSPPPPTKFAAEEAPVTITGTNWGEKALAFGSDGYVWCKSYTYSGTSATATAGSLTLNPSYHSCTWYAAGGSNPVELADKDISRGECSYVLSAAGGSSITGANCTSKPITITKPGCTVTVGPQTSASGLIYTNLGSGKLRTVKAEGPSALTYTATGASCPYPGTVSDGIIHHRVTLAATNSGGAAQGLSVE